MKKKIKDMLIKILFLLIEKYVDKEFGASATVSPLVKKQHRFLQELGDLCKYAESIGYIVTGGELWRHPIMQAYYLQKKATKVKYSKHQDRLAVDLNVFIDGKLRTDKEAYKPLAEYWRSLDPENVSGYDWGWDYNHFQKGK